jgi:hypothetical protein
MLILAAIDWNPSTIAGWLVAGLFAAWLGSKLMDEPSYGMVGDLIGGTVAGLCGGLAYGLFTPEAGFWGGTLVAFVAAGVVVLGMHAILGARGE